MKKSFFFAFIMIFMLSASTFAASVSKNPERTPKAENKLTAEEISRLTSRVEEIREMDKKDMEAKEKRELRKELNGIQKNVRRDSGAIYLGTGTLILIIILVILLV